MPNHKLADTPTKYHESYDGTTILSCLDSALTWIVIAEQEKEGLIVYRKELAEILYFLLDENHKLKPHYLKYIDFESNKTRDISQENLASSLTELMKGIEVFRTGSTDLQLSLERLSLVLYTLDKTCEHSELHRNGFQPIEDHPYLDEKESEYVYIQGRRTNLYLKQENTFLGKIKFQLTVWLFKLMNCFKPDK